MGAPRARTSHAPCCLLMRMLDGSSVFKVLARKRGRRAHGRVAAKVNENQPPLCRRFRAGCGGKERCAHAPYAPASESRGLSRALWDDEIANRATERIRQRANARLFRQLVLRPSAFSSLHSKLLREIIHVKHLLTPAPETESETEGEERRQEHRAPLGNRAEEIDGDESSREKEHLRRQCDCLHHGFTLSNFNFPLKSTHTIPLSVDVSTHDFNFLLKVLIKIAKLCCGKKEAIDGPTAQKDS